MLQHEAIKLGYALAMGAAENVGVRAIAIKGLAASTHQLRPDRTPADVDVLIEPVGFAALTGQLEQWGWRSRFGEYADLRAPHHSQTYIHDSWPCDIDAHHLFPGFLAPPQQVFEELWNRRVYLEIGERMVPAADWAASVAIAALHSSRSSLDNPRHSAELRTLIGLSGAWSNTQRTDLATLAINTGCGQSLDLVWQQLGVSVDSQAENISADDLAEWRLQRDGRMPGARTWLRYIVSGGPRDFLPRLGTALWPPEALMRADREIGEDGLALFKARLTRLVHVTLRAPGDLAAMAKGRANVTHQTLGSPAKHRR